MQPTELLNSLGLGEYIQAFEDNAIDAESLLSLSDADLKELGVAKLGHRKKILEAITSLSSPATSHAVDGIADVVEQLPNIVALPLREYASEEHPVAKLWAMCDTVELLLRLAVVVFVSKQREHGGLSEKTAESLSSLVESPTLGAWFVMAQTLAKDDADDSLRAAADFVEGPLKDLLYGPDKPGTAETSLLRLRNRLAHGGGLTRREAARLLQLWQPKFDGTVSQMNWLSAWELAGRDKEGCWLSLAGAEPATSNFSPEERSHEVDAVWIKIGPNSFPLWPLAVFGAAKAPGASKAGADDLTQIYTRRESVRLAYTPIGAEGIAQSESGASGFEAFKALFQLDRPRSSDFSVADFAAEMRKDAAQAVGRDNEVAAIVAAVHENDQGVLWISGAAGTGKSFLVAKAHAELLDRKPGDNSAVLAYRFRASDQARCSREALATFLEERLAAAGACVASESKDTGTDAAKRISDCLGRVKAGWRIVIFLDGLDEIARHDERFAEEIPLDIRLPNVLWVCSGRSEAGLAKAMDSLGAISLFPQGLPPMSNDDIRAMVLEKIGPLRKKLLAGDKEKGDSVINPFIDLVTVRAAGLPLYVKYVIGDVLSGKYRVLDGQEDLPESLHAYHEELLRRLAVGDLQAVVTPLVATLACAHEPLSVREIEAVLVYRKLLTPDGATALVEEGLAATASMLSSAPDPEGETGFTLFHQSLRDHMRTSEQMRQSMTTGIAAMAELSLGSDAPEPLRNYLLRCGVRHLLEAGRRDAAQKLLLDLDHLGRMEAAGVEAESIFALWRELGDQDCGQDYASKLAEYLAAPSSEKLKVARFVGKICGVAGWVGARRRIVEMSARSHESFLGPLDEWSITAGASWAASLVGQGLYAESKDLATSLLQRSRESLGTEHVQTLRCMNILAETLRWFGDAQASRNLLEESLSIGERSLGPDHRVTLGTAKELAAVLKEQGEFGEAEMLLKRVLKTREKVFGPLHPKTLESKIDLGYILSESGRKREAELLLRDAVVSSETECGVRHPTTLVAVLALGNHLRANAQVEEAESLLTHCAEITREVFGDLSRSHLASLNDLANALSKAGKLDRAEKMLRMVLEEYSARFGSGSDPALMARNNLALVLESQNNLEEADSILRECSEIHVKTKGEFHPDTLGSLSNLGRICGLRSRSATPAQAKLLIKEWESLSRAAVDGWTKVAGPSHYRTLRASSNLATMLVQQDRLLEATDLLRKVLEHFEDLRGPDDEEVLRAVSRLGWVLWKIGSVEWKMECLEEAAFHIERAYNGRAKILGATHEETLQDLEFLGTIVQETGDNEAALRIFEKLLEARRDKLGDEDPATLKVVWRVGSLRKSMGDYEAAESAFTTALEGFVKASGAMHPHTLQTAVSLSRLYKTQNRTEEEKAIYHRFLPAESELGEDLSPAQNKYVKAMRKRLRELQAA